MTQTSNLLKTQIREDFKRLIECSNELWRLRVMTDYAIDDLEASLRDAEILDDSLTEEEV
jgi:hypothetical protein